MPKKKYISGTSRKVKKRTDEHNSDMKMDNTLNATVNTGTNVIIILIKKKVDELIFTAYQNVFGYFISRG